MKVITHINKNMKRSARGFTLIEMVGVLAVIAILAALLVPKIFSAINESRLSSTVSTLNTCKTATMGYFGQKGMFTPATANFDQTLMAASLLDSKFQTKVGDGWRMESVVGAGGTGSGYNLDGVSNYSTNGAAVVQCVISNVPIADAIELSKRIDGDSLSQTNGAADSVGRVIYAAPVSGLTDVFVYIAHK